MYGTACVLTVLLLIEARASTICDDSIIWPDKELDCGECRVLVGNFNSKYM